MKCTYEPFIYFHGEVKGALLTSPISVHGTQNVLILTNRVKGHLYAQILLNFEDFASVFSSVTCGTSAMDVSMYV